MKLSNSSEPMIAVLGISIFKLGMSFFKSTFSIKLDRNAIPRPFPPNEPLPSRVM